MDVNDAKIVQVLEEIERAKLKFPMWPTDPVHAHAILMEEAGELGKAILECTYEQGKTSMAEIEKEAIQTAAMALRFIDSLGSYQFRASIQHYQEEVL